MYTILTLSNAIGQSANNYSPEWLSTVIDNIPGFVIGVLTTVFFRVWDMKKEHKKNCRTTAKYLFNLSRSLTQAIEDNTLESFKSFDKELFETSFPPIWNKWIKHSFMNNVSNDLYSERSFINEKLNELIYALKRKEDKVIYSRNREKIDKIILNRVKDLEDSSYNLVQLADRFISKEIRYELRAHVVDGVVLDKIDTTSEEVEGQCNDSKEQKIVEFRDRINFTELVVNFIPVERNIHKKFNKKLLALLEHYADYIMGVKGYENGFKIILYSEMNNEEFSLMYDKIDVLLKEFDFQVNHIEHVI